MKNQNIKFNTSLLQKITLTSFAVLFSALSVSYTFASDINQDNILNLLNQERTSRRLPKLELNDELSNAANLKSRDMINRNYFEHFAFGLTPWDFVKNAGYTYMYAGENLAMDFNTSEGMVDAWMNSPAHRENILNPDFRDVGIGVVKGEYTENGSTNSTIMVTNMFGRQKPMVVKVFDFITNNVLNNLI
jgi:uncharacterized protein YkwD